MRVPLTPADLLPQQGFKRLAKNLRRTWPSTQQITLSQSLEVLARGLGYRDYHDAYLRIDRLIGSLVHPAKRMTCRKQLPPWTISAQKFQTLRIHQSIFSDSTFLEA